MGFLPRREASPNRNRAVTRHGVDVNVNVTEAGAPRDDLSTGVRTSRGRREYGAQRSIGVS